jgi:uncharacterized protein (TIGR02996 family)
MTIDAFLRSIIADPHHADATWQVLADWLEDHDDPRSELVRLLHQPDYWRDLSPEARDDRVREMLASGMQPIVPTITNSIGMKFALIPAGSFLMGSPESEVDRSDHETQHPVTITRPFFLGIYIVTQQEYERVTGANPSYFSKTGGGKAKVKKLDTSRFPVEKVSHDDAVAFCKLLSELPEEQQCGRSYRLPTEAEWEYSCRGGATVSKPFHFGNSLCSTQANFNGGYPYGAAAKGPYLERPCPVGSYPANVFGLHDMHGNVWEWCEDWYAEGYYRTEAAAGPNPVNLAAASARVLRGGCWINDGRLCRSASHSRYEPVRRSRYCGFRLAAVPRLVSRDAESSERSACSVIAPRDPLEDPRRG